MRNSMASAISSISEQPAGLVKNLLPFYFFAELAKGNKFIPSLLKNVCIFEIKINNYLEQVANNIPQMCRGWIELLQIRILWLSCNCLWICQDCLFSVYSTV